MRRVVVDFDGVLHDDRGTTWSGPTDINGPPMPGAFDFLAWLVDSDYKPIVVTARLCQDPDDDLYPRGDPIEITEAIFTWFRVHGIPFRVQDALVIYPPEFGKPGALVYIDDKAVRFGSPVDFDNVKARLTCGNV